MPPPPDKIKRSLPSEEVPTFLSPKSSALLCVLNQKEQAERHWQLLSSLGATTESLGLPEVGTHLTTLRLKERHKGAVLY